MHPSSVVTPSLGDYAVGILKYVLFAAYIVGGLIWLVDKMTSFDDFREMFDRVSPEHGPNTAYLRIRAGIVIGGAIALDELISYKSGRPLVDLAWVVGGGVAAIGMLLLARLGTHKLAPFNADADHHTPAVGLVRMAMLVATGFVLAGGFSTTATSGKAIVLMLIMVPQALGLLALAYWLAQRRFGLHTQVAKGNDAAAWIASGLIVAAGLMLGGGIGGAFYGFWSAEVNFMIVVALVAVLFALVTWALDRWVFRPQNVRSIISAQLVPQAQYLAVLLGVLGYGLSNVAF